MEAKNGGGRWFSFSNRWFSGSKWVFQSAYCILYNVDVCSCLRKFRCHFFLLLHENSWIFVPDQPGNLGGFVATFIEDAQSAMVTHFGLCEATWIAWGEILMKDMKGWSEFQMGCGWRDRTRMVPFDGERSFLATIGIDAVKPWFIFKVTVIVMYSFWEVYQSSTFPFEAVFWCCWRCVMFFLQGENTSLAHVIFLIHWDPFSDWKRRRGMHLSSGIYLKRQQSRKILKRFSGPESGGLGGSKLNQGGEKVELMM